jgi:hypothetical protein
MARTHCIKTKFVSIGLQISFVNSHNLTNYDKTVAEVRKTMKAFQIQLQKVDKYSRFAAGIYRIKANGIY